MAASFRQTLARTLRFLLKRRRIDDPIDRIRFLLDTHPRSKTMQRVACVSYQPLPWVNLNEAERDEGTLSRWQTIRPWLERTSVRSALDVGCERGFFTLSLASAGIPAIGVENDPPAYRTALYAIRKAEIENAGVLMITITPANIGVLPAADTVLFLSLWHHFVRQHGLEAATAMSSALWERTRKVLFFDTGELEMPESFGLPSMTPSPPGTRDTIEKNMPIAKPAIT